MSAEHEMLTPKGRDEAEALARRHDVGPEAVVVLLQALRRGGGTQAQFAHPDLGGMGQWSRGGMIMVGDMFDHGLKARVDRLCQDAAALLDKPGVLRETGHDEEWRGAWWPEGLGRPSATGAQNDRRYACFPDARRLAIGRGDLVELYDTGEHRIHGVSQQQGRGDDLRFASQLGTVALHDLAQVDAGRPRPADKKGDRHLSSLEQDASKPVTEPDVLDTIERLHALQRKGILTEKEFEAKKADLLARL